MTITQQFQFVMSVSGIFTIKHKTNCFLNLLKLSISVLIEIMMELNKQKLFYLDHP